MRLQGYCCLAIEKGVAADTEARNIQGRGALFQINVMMKEKTRKKPKNRKFLPTTIDAATIAIAIRIAREDVLSETSGMLETGADDPRKYEFPFGAVLRAYGAARLADSLIMKSAIKDHLSLMSFFPASLMRPGPHRQR